MESVCVSLSGCAPLSLAQGDWGKSHCALKESAMKRTVKVNGHNYKFECPRNAVKGIISSLPILARAASVAYQHTTTTVIDEYGHLVDGGEGIPFGTAKDTEMMSGRAALADVCHHLSQNPDLSERGADQLNSILSAHEIDMTKVITTV
jgi:hypothetical protein